MHRVGVLSQGGRMGYPACNEMGDQWNGGPMRLGTNEMGGQWDHWDWPKMGGLVKRGTSEKGDQWIQTMLWGTYELRREPMRWVTSEMRDQWVGGTNEMGDQWNGWCTGAKWVAIEMGDQWDGGLLRWGTNEMGDQWDGGPMMCTRLSKAQIKEISKLWTTGLCEGNSPVTAKFPAQRASNAEDVSIGWRHHDTKMLPNSLGP